jgi:hypothetical protein
MNSIASREGEIYREFTAPTGAAITCQDAGHNTSNAQIKICKSAVFVLPSQVTNEANNAKHRR